MDAASWFLGGLVAGCALSAWVAHLLREQLRAEHEVRVAELRAASAELRSTRGDP